MKCLLLVPLAIVLAACADTTPDREQPVAGNPAAADVGGAPEAVEQRPVVYVDVRRPDEWAEGRVEGAIHIPHTEMAERWPELEAHRDSEIVLYCRTGRRSGIAEEILREAGFDNLHNGGGLADLERQGVPTER